MERKTKVEAENGKHDLFIIREFDLPLELLFKAYEDPEIYEEWMGSKVLKLDNRKHGSWHLQKKDSEGNILVDMLGVIHDFIPNTKIVRTFEMVSAGFEPQLEFLDFEKITEDTSKLTMQIVYRSVEARDQMLKLPFSQGVNMAHNQLQKVLNKFKK